MPGSVIDISHTLLYVILPILLRGSNNTQFVDVETEGQSKRLKNMSGFHS